MMDVVRNLVGIREIKFRMRYPYSVSDIPYRLANQNVKRLLPETRGRLQLHCNFDVLQML